ncbi:hypothetical protein [Microbacterium sp. P02]
MSTVTKVLAAAIDAAADPAERDELAMALAWHESADPEERA